MKSVIGIIPAKMASTRYPGKLLQSILGVPMHGHVYYRSAMSDLLDQVYIATCDQEIDEYMRDIVGVAIMTADTHKRASDRTAEAVKKSNRAPDKMLVSS